MVIRLLGHIMRFIGHDYQVRRWKKQSKATISPTIQESQFKQLPNIYKQTKKQTNIYFCKKTEL